MSIKTRIGKLEQEKGGMKPTILTFRTFYEGQDGSVEAETTRATIIWGHLRTGSVIRRQSESFEEFKTRVDGIGQLTWPEAQTAEGLVFPMARGVEGSKTERGQHEH